VPVPSRVHWGVSAHAGAVEFKKGKRNICFCFCGGRWPRPCSVGPLALVAGRGQLDPTLARTLVAMWADPEEGP